MRKIKIVASCVLGPPRTQWEYGVTPGTLEQRWQWAWVRYQQEQVRAGNLKAIRAILERMGPPPDPGPLEMSLANRAWFQNSATVSFAALDAAVELPQLDALDPFIEGGQHEQPSRRVRGHGDAPWG